MESNSIIISKTIKFFEVLNRFYENSVTYRALNKISKIAVKGVIVGSICRGLKKPNHNKYTEGSLLMRVIFGIFAAIFGTLKKIYVLLAKSNSTSLNKTLFDKTIIPITKLEKAVPAGASLLFGFFSIRTILALASQYGTTAIFINAVISTVFLILAFIDFGFLARAINGCTPKKIVVWLFGD